MTTKRRFFYHYNKPLTQQLGIVIWSVHFKNTCYFVKGFTCNVPSESKANKCQPYATMIGFANEVIPIKKLKTKLKNTDIYEKAEIN